LVFTVSKFFARSRNLKFASRQRKKERKEASKESAISLLKKPPQEA
jgi:hypothetical protein